MKYYNYILNNGLRILLIPNKDIKIINYNLSIKIGNDCENKKTLEMSHFLEHLMTVYTSKKYPCGTINRKFFSENNIKEEAETDNKIVTYRLEFQRKYLEIVCDYVINNLLDFVIDKNLYDNELNSVIEELNEIISDSNYEFETYINKILYKNHVRSVTQQERLEHIKNSTIDEIYQFQKKYVNSKNIIISFIGDFDKNNLLNILKKLDTKKIEGKEIIYNIRNNKIPKNVYFFKNNKKVCNLRVIFNINILYFDAIYYKIYALLSLLTDDLNSILLKKLRAIEGLVYDINGEMDLDEINKNLSIIMFSTSVNQSNLLKVIENILLILDNIKNEFIEDSLIKKYKQNIIIKKQKNMYQKMPDEILNEYCIYSLWNKPIFDQKSEYKFFSNIDKNSLKNTAKEIFDFKNLHIFYDGTKNYNNAIQNIINNYK